MYYVILKREWASDVYICGSRNVHDIARAQLFEDIAAARAAIESREEIVTWLTDSMCVSARGLFIIVERPDEVDWIEDLLNAVDKLDGCIPFGLQNEVRSTALVNGAIKHNAVVRVILSYETTHVRMCGKINSSEDADGALCVSMDDDTLIAFIRDDIDSVDIVDGVITIYLEA
jgi:nitrate reductase NapAB chaperone NapD